MLHNFCRYFKDPVTIKRVMSHYSLRPVKSKYGKLFILVSIVCMGIVAGVCTVGYQRFKKQNITTNTKPAVAKEKAINKETIASLKGRYLFNGTTVWARQVEKDSLKKDGTYDYAHPFSQLNTLHREQYDAWTTDFECPITNNTVSFREQVDNLVFNCRPEFLNEANKYFSLYDLANNHTDNQGGAVGLAATRKYLEQSGAQYFGSFDPSVAKDVCEVVALPIRTIKTDGKEEKAALPVALCAWHYFYRKPNPGEIEVMAEYAKTMPVFAFVEMGVEYKPTADSIQQEIAHKIIDQGPEFLIANNPHWVQNTEVYKGKLVIYSLGNFIFDQLDTETQRGASLDVEATTPYDANVESWLQLAKECKAFQDECLTKAQKLGLKKIPLSLHYAVVASQGGARKLTHLADQNTQRAVEQRMNWAESMKLIGQK